MPPAGPISPHQSTVRFTKASRFAGTRRRYSSVVPAMTRSCNRGTALACTPPGKRPASPPSCTSTTKATTGSPRASKGCHVIPGSTGSAIGSVNRVSSRKIKRGDLNNSLNPAALRDAAERQEGVAHHGPEKGARRNVVATGGQQALTYHL